MSTKYKATTTDEAYFIIITTVGWIDIFTRLNQNLPYISCIAPYSYRVNTCTDECVKSA